MHLSCLVQNLSCICVVLVFLLITLSQSVFVVMDYASSTAQTTTPTTFTVTPAVLLDKPDKPPSPVRRHMRRPEFMEPTAAVALCVPSLSTTNNKRTRDDDVLEKDKDDDDDDDKKQEEPPRKRVCFVAGQMPTTSRRAQLMQQMAASAPVQLASMQQMMLPPIAALMRSVEAMCVFEKTNTNNKCIKSILKTRSSQAEAHPHRIRQRGQQQQHGRRRCLSFSNTVTVHLI